MGSGLLPQASKMAKDGRNRFDFCKRIHKEGAGLNKAGDLGTRGAGLAYLPAKVGRDI